MTRTRSVLACDLRLEVEGFAMDIAFRTEARVTGVFGASGAGKTTLLECIAGLRPEARGTIHFGGEVWLDSEAGIALPPERREVGYVPQGGLLFPHLTVRRNVEVGKRRARSRGFDFDGTFARAAEILELRALFDREVHRLSGGERQRVALARALCSGARLLLLDEPLASLDLPFRRRLLPYLRRVRERFELPMILVSHDPFEVQALCDEVVVLRDGRSAVLRAPAEALAREDALASPDDHRAVSVFDARCEAAGEGGLELLLLDSERRLTLSRRARPFAVGDRALLSIDARRVVLSTERPPRISTPNVWSTTVSEIALEGDEAIIRLSLGHGPTALLAVVGASSAAALSIAPGSVVHVLVPEGACTLYSDARPSI